MPSHVDRRTVDLTAYPDLVVIYLGMRVRTVAGMKRLFGLGSQIQKAGAGRPDGLLHFMRGGMEAIYDDVNLPQLGFQAFAPIRQARGPMFSARARLHLPHDAPAQPPGVTERDLY